MKTNILANIVGKFWSVLSGFLFIPLYIKFLGFESYSVISFTLIIVGILTVLDSGLTATLSREFARNDHSIEEKRRIFNTLETSYLLIILFASVTIFFMSNFISNHWLNLKSIDPAKVSLIIKIIGFEAGFRMLFRFYMGGVLGFERQVKANVFQISWGIFRNGLVVALIYYVPSLELFFIWQFLITVVFTILMRSSLMKILHSSNNLMFNPILEKEIFLKVWRFAGGMLLISLVAALNTQMDKLFISKLLDIETLGYYTLAVSIAVGINVLISPISVALLPRYTSLYSNGKNIEATELFKQVYLIIVIIIFSVMANMIFFADKLIWIWTGDLNIAKKSGFFLLPLSISFVMLALSSVPYDIAIARGYTKLNNLLGIISLFFTIPGYWIATKLYGGIGAAYVFCCVQTVMTLIYLYYINKKFLNISKYELFIKKLLFPVVLAVSSAYLFSLIPNYYKDSRIFTFVWIGILTILTLGFTIIIAIPTTEIKMLLKLRKR